MESYSQKTYGAGEDDDKGRYSGQTADNGYLVSARTDSFGVGGFDFMLLKIASDGGMGGSCSDSFGADSQAEIEDAQLVVEDTDAAGADGEAIAAEMNFEANDSGAVIMSLCSN